MYNDAITWPVFSNSAFSNTLPCWADPSICAWKFLPLTYFLPLEIHIFFLFNSLSVFFPFLYHSSFQLYFFQNFWINTLQYFFQKVLLKASWGSRKGWGQSIRPLLPFLTAFLFSSAGSADLLSRPSYLGSGSLSDQNLFSCFAQSSHLQRRKRDFIRIWSSASQWLET